MVLGDLLAWRSNKERQKKKPLVWLPPPLSRTTTERSSRHQASAPPAQPPPHPGPRQLRLVRPPLRPCHSSAAAHGHRHADQQPASPSLLRSPSAWIRAKGHSFGPGKHAHRRAGNFHYDARSYAQNFDEGGGEEDAPRHQCFSPRIATAPQLAASPSSYGTGGRGNGA